MSLKLCYCVYQLGYGWHPYVSEAESAGVTGEGKRVEAVRLHLIDNAPGTGIIYEINVQDKNWLPAKRDNEMAGTLGENRSARGLKIRLDNIADKTIQYRVHVAGNGWSNWVSEGESAGIIVDGGWFESIEVRLINK